MSLLVLDVISEPQKASLRAIIAAEGGSIGRASTNTLALPDPQRTVSRVRVQISPRPGGVSIVSRSCNGLSVNGVPVEFGDEVPLRDGCILVIGGYASRTSISGPQRADGSDDTTLRVRSPARNMGEPR